MKKHFICLIVILLLLSSHAGEKPVSSKIEMHFFGSSTCGECKEIKQELLTPLMKQYSEKLKIYFHDIDSKDGFRLLDAMEKTYNVKHSAPQELFFPDTFLLGYNDIMQTGYGMIMDYMKKSDSLKIRQVKPDSTKYVDVLKSKFQRFTFLGILAAGIVDGVNPCAIATMIFLISFLAMKKRARKEILIVGLCFSASVFITYLMIGLGAFKALTTLKQYYLLSKTIKWVAVIFAGAVSVGSFYDAFAYSRSGKTRDIKIQLPKFLKLKIHRVISSNLSGTQLIMGSIVTGFLVTLLEAVCTGQVYIPTIILMTRESGLKLQGWIYLIFYNFLFILPLLMVMALGYHGLTWNTLSKLAQKHLALLKIMLGTVLAGLAAFLYVSI